MSVFGRGVQPLWAAAAANIMTATGQKQPATANESGRSTFDMRGYACSRSARTRQATKTDSAAQGHQASHQF